jgi:hypothetical protein
VSTNKVKVYQCSVCLTKNARHSGRGDGPVSYFVMFGMNRPGQGIGVRPLPEGVVVGTFSSLPICLGAGSALARVL